jgi:hypothetical protein
MPISADVARCGPSGDARCCCHGAAIQPKGPTAVSDDQASELQLPGSGGRDLNLRPLGYETYDARLRCLGPSPVTALTSADLRREVCLGLPRLPCLSPSRCVCAQIRAQNRFLTCGFLCLPLRTCAHPHLPEHPVTVDQPVRERARPTGSRWSAPPNERPLTRRPGLLGSRESIMTG